jgi:hypothetical protein
MTSQQIRSLSTPALKQVANGMAGADRISRLIASQELDRRRRA